MPTAPTLPNIVAMETSVTDAIYSGGDETLKAQFFAELPALLDTNPAFHGLLKEPPRAGDNILIPAEAWEHALLEFNEQHSVIPMKRGPINSPGMNKAKFLLISHTIFGDRQFQAGGSLANSFDAMAHSTLNGKELIDGVFITALGEGQEARVFGDALRGKVSAVMSGTQTVAHIIPISKDRIIVATPGGNTPCATHLNAKPLQDADLLNADTDMLMLGGYLFYTPHFKEIFDVALSRVEALNQERKDAGKKPITLVLTCAAQKVAAAPEFRDMVARASRITDVIVHANTGEFRRLLNNDTHWRIAHEAKWGGLSGHALEAAKKADDDYQHDKAQANLETIHQCAVPMAQACLPHRLKFVVTNGARGIYVADANGHRTYKTAHIDPSRIVNTVGAGDNFAGGYELGVALGLSEPMCITLARDFAGAVIQQDAPRLAATTSRRIADLNGTAHETGGALAHLDAESNTSQAALERIAATTQQRGR